jgi:hypothetical protein
MQCPRDGVAHSLGGLVYFEEYAELNGVQMFMFVCGSLITIGGIGYLLRYRRCGVECVCVCSVLLVVHSSGMLLRRGFIRIVSSVTMSPSADDAPTVRDRRRRRSMELIVRSTSFILFPA